MKLRKIRYVAVNCPIKRKNCDTCKYCYGFERDNGTDKVYCNYQKKV